ncbi:MAG TPA: four helix bundle protein [Vicinamibacterales bacterium]|nr:four helix bundle protein [Vicinamibacterales bacterium]
MNAATLDELLVYRKARELDRAITALVRHSDVRKDRMLAEQMNAASLSVVSNIAEGFEQTTDRSFARYLVISRASASELRSHISICGDRHELSDDVVATPSALCSEVIRMLTPLIAYLTRSNRIRRRT